MQLETQRLILRPWSEEDAETLYQYAKSPHVGPSAGWPPHTSIENSREIIRDVLSAPETYAVVMKDSLEPVGSVGLILKANERHSDIMGNHDGEIGYWIGEPFWGKGLIPEAVAEIIRHGFEDLNLENIWCGFYEGNEKSQRVAEKSGFVYHHKEINAPVPLLNTHRTEYFYILKKNDWKNTTTKSNPN